MQVSIPAWCDWESGIKIFLELGKSVSIPAWCDWEDTGYGIRKGDTAVSIPAWCDWETKWLHLCRAASFSFQFQLGAIGSVISHCF